MKETIKESVLTEDLGRGRVEATIVRLCPIPEHQGDAVHVPYYNVSIVINYESYDSYDGTKLSVLDYFNKLKLDTNKLMIDSSGKVITINPRISDEPVEVISGIAEPYVVLSGSTEKKKKAGWPKGKPRGPKKKKVEVTTEDLLNKVDKNKSKKLNADFFMNLPEDNVFSQAGR